MPRRQLQSAAVVDAPVTDICRARGTPIHCGSKTVNPPPCMKPHAMCQNQPVNHKQRRIASALTGMTPTLACVSAKLASVLPMRKSQFKASSNPPVTLGPFTCRGTQAICQKSAGESQATGGYLCELTAPISNLVRFPSPEGNIDTQVWAPKLSAKSGAERSVCCPFAFKAHRQCLCVA